MIINPYGLGAKPCEDRPSAQEPRCEKGQAE
jgi:hypothetical protein